MEARGLEDLTLHVVSGMLGSPGSLGEGKVQRNQTVWS